MLLVPCTQYGPSMDSMLTAAKSGSEEIPVVWTRGDSARKGFVCSLGTPDGDWYITKKRMIGWSRCQRLMAILSVNTLYLRSLGPFPES